MARASRVLGLILAVAVAYVLVARRLLNMMFCFAYLLFRLEFLQIPDKVEVGLAAEEVWVVSNNVFLIQHVMCMIFRKFCGEFKGR